MVVQRLKPLPIEAVVRGYLIGSGWKDYQRDRRRLRHRAAAGACARPSGCRSRSSRRRPRPRLGEHDENISFDAWSRIDRRGARRAGARHRRWRSIRVRRRATRARAASSSPTRSSSSDSTQRGRLILIDEVLTPDSSRFWPADSYATGTSPPSFDKQFVRDYLETLDWDKRAPGPRLPPEMIERTGAKYAKRYRRLTS